MDDDVETSELANIIPQEQHLVSLEDSNIIRQRQIAKMEFYSQKPPMANRIQKTDTVSQIMDIAMTQMADAYDDLSGTQQLFLKKGQLVSSTMVADKKTQVLQRLTNIAKKKDDMESKKRNIDLTSPQVKILISLVFQKASIVIQNNVQSSDLKLLMINQLKESLRDWDKEYKQRIKRLQK